jgi:hypothetical protein
MTDGEIDVHRRARRCGSSALTRHAGEGHRALDHDVLVTALPI